MEIKVKIDASALKAKTLRESKRLAYSTAQALNETAKEIQTAERVQIDQQFTVRKAGFMYRLIKIFQFASPKKGIPFAEVGIDTSKDRVLLSLFEEGGERPAAVGKNVAVPITGEAARPEFSAPVPQSLTFRALHFRKRKGGKIAGNQGTYLIPDVGVFQRVAGAAKAALIYTFQRPMQLKKRLRFVDLAKQVFEREFRQRFDRIYRR